VSMLTVLIYRRSLRCRPAEMPWIVALLPPEPGGYQWQEIRRNTGAGNTWIKGGIRALDILGERRRIAPSLIPLLRTCEGR
jgi:hypothetical protein